jgi:hypothetical protein
VRVCIKRDDVCTYHVEQVFGAQNHMDFRNIFHIMHIRQDLTILVQRFDFLQVDQAAVWTPLLHFLNKEWDVHSRFPNRNWLNVLQILNFINVNFFLTTLLIQLRTFFNDLVAKILKRYALEHSFLGLKLDLVIDLAVLY